MSKVSICIPIYNGSAFLRPCIESALAQSHPDLEIVMVDDCSTDNSAEIARSLTAGVPGVHFSVNVKNRGLVGNWNRCVELASGAWIKFLFQDDMLDPHCVAKLLQEAEQRSAKFVVCGRSFVFDTDTDAQLEERYRKNSAAVTRFLAPTRGVSAEKFAVQVLQHFDYNYVGEPTATLLHRSVFERYGPFNAELAQLCDIEYWARVASHEGLAFVPEELASFRVHASATSALNRESKSFRASGLDSLVLWDTMINDPPYTELRRLWAEQGLLDDARQQYRDRANQVMQYVRSNADDSVEAQARDREYAEFLNRNPRCRVSLSQHRWWLLGGLPSSMRSRLGHWLQPLLPGRLRRE